jgi:XTP/dITP diphosphohydrolase
LNIEVDETGQTYVQNAALKALAFAKATGMLALADDSGLEVDALGGLPGLHSARFAPQPGAQDADRRAYLLERLQGNPRPWLARFRCVIAVAREAERPRFAEGVCQGEIIPEERGQNGFGYDPIFLIPDLGKTMAELSMEEKNQLSHRARAVLAARPILVEMLDKG